MSAESLILFFIVGAFLVGIALLFSSYIPPTSTNPQKAETYECGIPTEGLSWLQFNVGYYLFAIISWYLTLKQYSSSHGQKS